MYAKDMRDQEALEIQRLVTRFLSGSSALEIHLQKQRPLTPLQMRTISLTVSMLQLCLERWMKQHGQNVKPLGISLTYSSAGAVLGRLGGSKGGKARAKKLSQNKRVAIAKLAALSRWGKNKS